MVGTGTDTQVPKMQRGWGKLRSWSPVPASHHFLHPYLSGSHTLSILEQQQAQVDKLPPKKAALTSGKVIGGPRVMGGNFRFKGETCPWGHYSTCDLQGCFALCSAASAGWKTAQAIGDAIHSSLPGLLPTGFSQL